MRKYIIICILMSFLIFSSIFAEENEEFDFRQARWGMTLDEVFKSEPGLEKIEEGKYKKTVNYMERVAIACFLFEDNKLTSGFYLFTKSILPDYVDEYLAVAEQLKKKYGDKYDLEMKWNVEDSPYREDMSLAVARGHLAINCTWETSRTIILQQLSGDKSGSILHLVSYFDASNPKYKKD